jgi:hypothetical protein
MSEDGPKNVTGTTKKLDENAMVSRIKTGLNWCWSQMLKLVFGIYVDGYGHKNGMQLVYISLGR